MTLERRESASDLVLVRAAAAGDREAFEKLYRQYYQRVYSICLRMLGDPARAADLTQEVFLTVYRKIGSFRGESAFTTWLYRLTVNQVLMFLRKRPVRLEQSVDEDELIEIGESGAAGARTASLIDRIALDEAISALPPGYRAVFVLHDVEGYQHDEIAEMLGVSIGTSKSQLHKARMRLRKLLSRKNSGLEPPELTHPAE